MAARITVVEYESITHGEDQGDKKTVNHYDADTDAIGDREYSNIIRMWMDTIASESHEGRFTVRNSHGDDWHSVAIYNDADKHYIHISLQLNI